MTIEKQTDELGPYAELFTDEERLSAQEHARLYRGHVRQVRRSLAELVSADDGHGRR